MHMMGNRLRDANDWRAGDPIEKGPDWEGSFYSTDYHSKEHRTWAEYWRQHGDYSFPVVGRVNRIKGNVVRISVCRERYRTNQFTITPNGRRYIINPACENGGYRDNNNPDPKYATDNQGRFIRTGKKSTR